MKNRVTKWIDLIQVSIINQDELTGIFISTQKINNKALFEFPDCNSPPRKMESWSNKVEPRPIIVLMGKGIFANSNKKRFLKANLEGEENKAA